MSSLPIHLKVQALIARELRAGRWQLGDRLPPESELATQLGCAVGTLRRALADLATQGQIERRHGSGTYVKALSETKPIYNFFQLETLQGGGLPTAQILSFERIAHPTDFAPFGENSGNHHQNAARGKNAAMTYRIRRLRSLDHQVVALEEIFFDARHAPQLALAELGEALYLFYQQRLNVWITRAIDRVGISTVPTWTNPLFQPLAGEACGFIERASFAAHDSFEEFSRTWFDATRCRYVSRLS